MIIPHFDLNLNPQLRNLDFVIEINKLPTVRSRSNNALNGSQNASILSDSLHIGLDI